MSVHRGWCSGWPRREGKCLRWRSVTEWFGHSDCSVMRSGPGVQTASGSAVLAQLLRGVVRGCLNDTLLY